MSKIMFISVANILLEGSVAALQISVFSVGGGWGRGVMEESSSLAKKGEGGGGD